MPAPRIRSRLYDKTAEIALKGTDWWEFVWGERHTTGVPLWRIEFEIGRAAFSALELYRPDDVLVAALSLWRYCTADRLTLRSPSGDASRSRWPLDARWGVVQSATLVHGGTEPQPSSAAEAGRLLNRSTTSALEIGTRNRHSNGTRNVPRHFRAIRSSY